MTMNMDMYILCTYQYTRWMSVVALVLALVEAPAALQPVFAARAGLSHLRARASPPHGSFGIDARAMKRLACAHGLYNANALID